MGWMTVIVGAAGAAALIVLWTALRSGRPWRRLGGSFVQGLCAIAAVDVAGIFTGVSLGINWVSLACCGIFGVPGVVSLLLMRWMVLFT